MLIPSRLSPRYFTLLILVISCSQALQVAADDWLQWRGPNHNGIAAKGTAAPVEFGPNKNVVWKSPVPGRGHSSPTIVDGKIYLTTADETEEIQSILCYDRKTGKRLWNKKLLSDNFTAKIHQKNTHASPTIASDGESLFVYFNNNDAAILFCLRLDGTTVWQKRVAGYQPAFPFGFAPSPTIYKDSVIVSAESKVGVLAAYNRKTGEPIWKIDRKRTSFSSPIVAKVAGRDQLLLSGGSKVSSFDPETGKELWSVPAAWQVSCGTLVWDDECVYASGGFPRAQTLAIKADGSGKIEWENRIKCYEQSMLYHDDFLYGISDQGVGYCWEAKTGKEMWKARMKGPVSCSPIYVNGNIYYASERGDFFVFRATSASFQLLSKAKLGDSAFATPSFCDDQMFVRIAHNEDGNRQEYLYCFSEQNRP